MREIDKNVLVIHALPAAAFNGSVNDTVISLLERMTKRGMHFVFDSRPEDDDLLQTHSWFEAGGLFVNSTHIDLEAHQQCGSISHLGDDLRNEGRIVIPIGYGTWPEDRFLQEVDLAALAVGSSTPPVEAVFRCSNPGIDGFIQWCEAMTRRLKLMLTKKEMQQRDAELQSTNGGKNE